MKKPSGEFQLIEKLTRSAPKKGARLIRAIGDDCAVTRHGAADLLTTTDMLAEKVHFDRRWTRPFDLGWKALAVNLSDIAAMGGRPAFYFVSIAVPKDCDERFLLSFYEGMRACGEKFDCALAGGDTVASKKGFVVSITVTGESQRGKAILRSQAKDGDVVFCTGKFGGASAGLLALQKKADRNLRRRFVKRLSVPMPRLQEGKWLASTGLVTSAIDVSDGLVADLSHIADESGLGFIVDAVSVPQEKGLSKIADTLGQSAISLALTGGEDYELLFTVKSGGLNKFEAMYARSRFRGMFTKIGVMVGDKKTRVCLDSGGKMILGSKGFDHFK